ncbi:hypothetical protein GCM10010174_38880 [Kutzneria viridogrisea]|uniref:Uncharacterized protein n=1 Tax=Kutzneria viridogrisea TaxID=47990 RepID=A0ABR6BIQ4_9PSEU|nr:hypothetical protein [Kutzneria viridogrisea]
MPSDEIATESVLVAVRFGDGTVDGDRAWADIDIEMFRSAVQWRTFRWYHGQRRHSGSYWCVPTSDHVIYESRLELARLLFADFDKSVRHIASQPF